MVFNMVGGVIWMKKIGFLERFLKELWINHEKDLSPYLVAYLEAIINACEENNLDELESIIKWFVAE